MVKSSKSSDICNCANVILRHGKIIVHAEYTRVKFAEEWAPKDAVVSSNTHHKDMKF